MLKTLHHNLVAVHRWLFYICKIGFEASIGLVSEAVRLHGPFHGVIGFSQGAALTALICLQKGIQCFRKIDPSFDLKSQYCISNENKNFPEELLKFKFAILFSGFRSHSSQHSHIYKV